MHAPLMIRDLGSKQWPGVPVQVHFGRRDAIRMEQPIVNLKQKVEASGAAFDLYDYDVATHLFADSGFASYDAGATELMLSRVLAFLANQ
jgi:dienelactone hydrolase